MAMSRDELREAITCDCCGEVGDDYEDWMPFGSEDFCLDCWEWPDHEASPIRAHAEHPQPTRTWNHARKGLIRGVVVGGVDPWVQIRLVGEQELHHYSEENRSAGPHPDGEIITVRRSLLTELDGGDS